MDPRRTLQPVQPPQRRGLHRPSDRLGHRRHERPPVGRTDAGRRELRRRTFVLQHEERHTRHPRLRLLPAHASGTRRRERTLLDHNQRGRRTARQLALRHDQGSYRVPQGARDRLYDRRGCRHAVGDSLQGQPRPGQVGEGVEGDAQGAHTGSRADRHEQHGRRTARIDGQHPRGIGAVPPLRRAFADRLGPLRRERILHQDARRGLRR